MSEHFFFPGKRFLNILQIFKGTLTLSKGPMGKSDTPKIKPGSWDIRASLACKGKGSGLGGRLPACASGCAALQQSVTSLSLRFPTHESEDRCSVNPQEAL